MLSSATASVSNGYTATAVVSLNLCLPKYSIANSVFYVIIHHTLKALHGYELIAYKLASFPGSARNNSMYDP